MDPREAAFARSRRSMATSSRPRRSTSSVGRSARRAVQRRAVSYSPQQRYSPPQVYSNSSGNYAAPKSVPSSNAGPITPIKPKPPGIWSYLGKDSTYQQQIREFGRAFADMKGDVFRRRGIMGGEYNTSKRALGQQRTKDLESIEEDFASRGLLKSGLYADDVGDYEKEYNERLTDMARRNKQGLSALEQELGKFRAHQRLQRQAAKESAIRRRAEKYGL